MASTAASNPTSTTADLSVPEINMIQEHVQQLDYHEDPLLISQTLTYVTDDGSTVMSFQSAPFSLGFKFRFILLEVIFLLLLITAVPIGAHGTVVAVSILNLLLVAWFWYNLVRSVDITTDNALRFWIGNIELDVPFDKIVSLRRVALETPCSVITCRPHRGFLANPMDGVCIVTTVPSTPFWLWPRSAGKPDRSCCYGFCACPRLTVVFSPAGGSLAFIRTVENEMRSGGTSSSNGGGAVGGSGGGRMQPPSMDVRGGTNEFLDV